VQNCPPRHCLDLISWITGSSSIQPLGAKESRLFLLLFFFFVLSQADSNEKFSLLWHSSLRASLPPLFHVAELSPIGLQTATSMHEIMSRLSPVPRSQSRASLTPTETTYHSFLDVELYEPIVRSPSPRRSAFPDPFPNSTAPTQDGRVASKDMAPTTLPKIHRHDSGYESTTPQSPHPSPPQRRFSLVTRTSWEQQQRSRTRPAIRRSPKSAPVARLPRNSGQYTTQRQSCSSGMSSQHNRRYSSTFFHFPHFPLDSRPSCEDTELVVNTHLAPGSLHQTQAAYRPASAYQDSSPLPRSETPTFPVPPQTTHYWTSDGTRRLEYAAIDAATRGVRGWVMRHMVPDCFMPREKRHVRFEDDRGSVVRYRLDLDCDDVGEKHDYDACKRRKWKTKAWWFSSRDD
jgi:hypothetical protein